MLLHAKDTANKIGTEGLRYLSESRRTKTSAIQSQLDQMDDQLLLDTVKSRHLSSPSPIVSIQNLETGSISTAISFSRTAGLKPTAETEGSTLRKPRPRQTLFGQFFSIIKNINKAYHPEKEDEQPYMKHHN